ncbi:MAG TPA: SRPBCC family protein [Vicinamibacterales bacterium]|nr:SRPBCC family protein [Vicinamibacterales bacterium]
MRNLVKLLVGLVVLLVVLAGVAALVGMALPASHEATRSARIDAPASAIYSMLIVPEAYPEWRPDVERVERMDADRFREYGKDGPIVFRIVDRQPPSRLVVAVDDPDQPFSGTWTFELQPEGAQGQATRVRITERGDVPNPLFRAIARVLMSPTEGIEAYLRNLGRRFGQDVTIEP